MTKKDPTQIRMELNNARIWVNEAITKSEKKDEVLSAMWEASVVMASMEAHHADLAGDADMNAMLLRCLDILKVKGEDYTEGSVDRLANFKRAAEEYDITPMKALGIYWGKHVSAVKNFIKTGGQSESEPIEGRIADVINYMLLFSKMVAVLKAQEADRLDTEARKCDVCHIRKSPAGECLNFNCPRSKKP